MRIDIARDAAITLAAWGAVFALLLAMSGQIGGARADIKSLQQDSREMRQFLISHLVYHAGEGRKDKSSD